LITRSSAPARNHSNEEHRRRVDVNAQHDVNIGGDVVGRDKITEIVEGDKVAATRTSSSRSP
jgi:hypothetical protein